MWFTCIRFLNVNACMLKQILKALWRGCSTLSSQTRDTGAHSGVLLNMWGEYHMGQSFSTGTLKGFPPTRRYPATIPNKTSSRSNVRLQPLRPMQASHMFANILTTSPESLNGNSGVSLFGRACSIGVVVTPSFFALGERKGVSRNLLWLRGVLACAS